VQVRMLNRFTQLRMLGLDGSQKLEDVGRGAVRAGDLCEGIQRATLYVALC